MNTVTLHRVLKAPPQRVYQAFVEADALAKWLPPHGFTCKVAALDARVGGQFRMSFTHFASGHTHAFGGEYLALEPGKRIRYTDRFDDPTCRGRCRSPSPSPRCCAAPISPSNRRVFRRSSRWRCATSAGRSP